jgi:hypothetical protein
MTMAPLTRKEITDITGPLDDELVLRIVDSGASLADLVEAHGWFVDSRAMGKARHHRPAGNVAELCEILEQGWVPREQE